MEKRYYYLKEGEIIKEGDLVEVSARYSDPAKWVKASIRTIGSKAPNPAFISHRKYKRLIVTADEIYAANIPVPCTQANHYDTMWLALNEGYCESYEAVKQGSVTTHIYTYDSGDEPSFRCTSDDIHKHIKIEVVQKNMVKLGFVDTHTGKGYATKAELNAVVAVREEANAERARVKKEKADAKKAFNDTANIFINLSRR